MSKKLLLSAFAGIAVLCLSSAALADFNTSNQDVYVGVQGGYGTTNWTETKGAVELISPTASIRDDGIAGRVFAGYDFNQYLGGEVGFTKFSDTKINLGAYNVLNVPSSANISTYGVDLLGKIRVPVVDGFGLYAKAGPGYLRSSDHGKIDNINLVYGLGADYHLTDHLVADVSFLRYNGNHNTDSNDYQPNADLYAAGLAYKFNL